jgi:hypothetical protein
LPKIIAVLFSGFWSAISGPLKADYEVVTYRDGVKISSDSGAQSLQLNFIAKLIQLGLLVFIGGFLTIIHVFYLSIKNVVLYLKATTKPAFKESGLFIIVINVAVVIGSFFIAGAIQQILGSANVNLHG